MSVGRTVRRMARLAAFHLHRLMLKYKWASLIGMTREANGVLRRRGSHLLCPDRSVRVVAVAALNQPLIHAMVKGHAELRLLLKMAGVTKLRLGFYQQEFPGLRMVRRMTGDATDITLRVQGIDGLHLLGAGRMAGQATIIDFLGGMVFENKNLRHVTPAGNVGCPWTVASFASLFGGSPATVVQCFPVWSLFVIVVDILMAGLACIRPDVIGGVCSGSGRLTLRGEWAGIGRNLGLNIPWSGSRACDRRCKQCHHNAGPSHK